MRVSRLFTEFVEEDAFSVSNPDADHIGGFLDVFDAFEVGVAFS